MFDYLGAPHENANGLQAIFFILETMQTSNVHSQVYGILSLTIESEPGMLQPRGPEQQFAFKDLMTHLILQFALHIAFRGVLHRCGNPEIHR